MQFVILEVTDSNFELLRGKIRRLCEKVQETPHFNHIRSKPPFEAHVQKLEEKLKQSQDPQALEASSTILVFCDIMAHQERPGEGVLDLRKYIRDIWEKDRTSWLGKQPVIVFSGDDETFRALRGLARHKRAAPSAIISKSEAVGEDWNELLKAALSEAIHVCR